MSNPRFIFIKICITLILQSGISVPLVDSYVLPEPTFEVLKPRGLRVSIPADNDRLQFFAFHGNVNKYIGSNQIGDISGEVYAAKNERWTIEDTDVNLRNGDIIHYWMYVQAAGITYRKDNQQWTITINSPNVITQSTENPEVPTRASATEGRLVLDENFDSLNKTIWRRSVKMPYGPDYEFCVYHNENHEHVLQVADGILRFKPLLLEDYYGENATIYGRLQLGGCTSTIPIECSRHAVSYNILPPVLSARLTTKDSFSFVYGKVEIRAKFPEGDWIYPEMWLEPRYQSYGPGYASGRILLGLSRGNENLVNISNRSIYDSRRLDFGVRVMASSTIREHIVSKIQERGPRWTQDFHVYTTVWNTDGFQFLVDGEEVGRLYPAENSWLEDDLMREGRRSAPFDQEVNLLPRGWKISAFFQNVLQSYRVVGDLPFYLTLGIGVGGVRMFPDDLTSSGYPKPWRNVGAKAMLKFWHSRTQWLPSWRRENGKLTRFEIDYIRVWSS